MQSNSTQQVPTRKETYPIKTAGGTDADSVLYLALGPGTGINPLTLLKWHSDKWSKPVFHLI